MFNHSTRHFDRARSTFSRSTAIGDKSQPSPCAHYRLGRDTSPEVLNGIATLPFDQGDQAAGSAEFAGRIERVCAASATGDMPSYSIMVEMS